MKSMAIFLSLTIAAAAAVVACGGDKPAADPSTATSAASGEVPSTDTPATAASEAAPAASAN